MGTPFKMKGMSFVNSPIKQKDHPVTPPTDEQSKKSKGTLTKAGGNLFSFKSFIKDVVGGFGERVEKAKKNPNPFNR